MNLPPAGRTGNEAGGYGERWRVGLHFTQPNLPESLSKCHSSLTLNFAVRGFNDSRIGREKGIGGLRLYQQEKGLYFGLGG